MRNDAAVHEMHHLILSLHPTFSITWHCWYWLQMMKTTTMAMGTSMVMTMTHHQQLLLQLPQALVSTCLLWCIAFKWCLWRVLWYTMQLCCIWFMAERHKVSTGLLTLLLLLPCTTTAMLVSDGNLWASAGVHCRTWACHTLLCLSRHQVWTRACHTLFCLSRHQVCHKACKHQGCSAITCYLLRRWWWFPWWWLKFSCILCCCW